MLDFRKKIFIIIGLVVLIIITVVLFLLFRKPKAITNTGTLSQTVTETQTQPAVQPGTPAVKPAEAAKPKAPAVPPAEFYAKQLAEIFVERFLSYSNQNNNQHIYDVLGLCTEKMASWVSKQLIQPGVDYQGVNTTVVASSVKESTASKAVISIGVQRVWEGRENKTEYKDGRVELVKVGDSWKVDGLYFDK